MSSNMDDEVQRPLLHSVVVVTANSNSTPSVAKKIASGLEIGMLVIVQTQIIAVSLNAHNQQNQADRHALHCFAMLGAALATLITNHVCMPAWMLIFMEINAASVAIAGILMAMVTVALIIHHQIWSLIDLMEKQAATIRAALGLVAAFEAVMITWQEEILQSIVTLIALLLICSSFQSRLPCFSLWPTVILGAIIWLQTESPNFIATFKIELPTVTWQLNPDIGICDVINALMLAVLLTSEAASLSRQCMTVIATNGIMNAILAGFCGFPISMPIDGLSITTVNSYITSTTASIIVAGWAFIDTTALPKIIIAPVTLFYAAIAFTDIDTVLWDDPLSTIPALVMLVSVWLTRQFVVGAVISVVFWALFVARSIINKRKSERVLHEQGVLNCLKEQAQQDQKKSYLFV